MNFPSNLLYTRDHEWARVEDDGSVTVGVTDFAQSSLGGVVYVELPDEGAEVAQGDGFGNVESTKSVSELYAPIGGRIVAVNETLTDRPELVNEDPYGEGWMVRLEPADKAELDDLMQPGDYETFVAEQ